MGYYVDIGARQLIIDGEIKIERVQVALLDEASVNLEAETHLDADLVVYAVGYESMNRLVGGLIGQDIVDGVGKVCRLVSDTNKDSIHGKESRAICGNPPNKSRFAYMVKSSIKRVIIANSSPCRSRRGWKTFQRPFTAYKKSINLANFRPARL